MFAFSYIIDIPLIALVLLAFLANFQSFAYSKDVDTSVDLIAMLPQARLRVASVLILLLAICWFANVGVWVVLILTFFIGLLPALVIANDQAGGTVLVAAAAFVREFAFGFPTLVLRPRIEIQSDNHELVGQKGVVATPLKPSGQITIGQTQMLAVSESGDYIDQGSEITITGIKNGVPTARRIESVDHSV